MTDVVKIITNERGTVTHVLSSKGRRLSMAQLADLIASGEECFALFSDRTRCPLSTTVNASDRIVPVLHDPVGKRTLLDLPEHEDTGEDENIDAMFSELTGANADDEEFGDDVTIGDAPTGPTTE